MNIQNKETKSNRGNKGDNDNMVKRAMNKVGEKMDDVKESMRK
ncbi:hypothetical protein [Clostridium massiliamazoniense]|nr:hypothetical protein [Clostridium massiliamazoniense]